MLSGLDDSVNALFVDSTKMRVYRFRERIVRRFHEDACIDASCNSGRMSLDLKLVANIIGIFIANWEFDHVQIVK